MSSSLMLNPPFDTSVGNNSVINGVINGIPQFAAGMILGQVIDNFIGPAGTDDTPHEIIKLIIEVSMATIVYVLVGPYMNSNDLDPTRGWLFTLGLVLALKNMSERTVHIGTMAYQKLIDVMNEQDKEDNVHKD